MFEWTLFILALTILVTVIGAYTLLTYTIVKIVNAKNKLEETENDKCNEITE